MLWKSVLTFLAFCSFCFGLTLPTFAASWSYRLSYDAKSKQMHIEAILPAGVPLKGGEEAEVYFTKFEGESLSKAGGKLPNKVPACGKVLCPLRYSFDLAAASNDKGGLNDSIQSIHDIYLFNPSIMLLFPKQRDAKTRVEFQLKVSNASETPKTFFESGLFLDPKDPNLRIATADHLEDLPWTIVGAYTSETFEVKGARIDLAVIPAKYGVSQKDIRDWAERATSAVVAYYKEFPVNHTLVVVVPRDVYNGPGKSFGDGGAVTINPLSLKASLVELKKDWVMTHEMIHLAFPSVPYKHHWIEEGLATYIEPIARIRSGELKAESVFLDMMKGMPQGLPQKGDGGLDGPATWSKTYWGGAVFAFLSDIEIRKASKGKKGLDDALRGIIKEGGTMAVTWDFLQVLKAADASAGSNAFSRLYDAMKKDYYPVDLDQIWKDLGVVKKGEEQIEFRDDAPLAYVRKAIVQGSAP